MVQVGINAQYRESYLKVSDIVERYLKSCFSCRNSRIHLVNHIMKTYPNINPESCRRASQRLQNDLGMYLAEPETQTIRQARELWMEKEGHLL